MNTCLCSTISFIAAGYWKDLSLHSVLPEFRVLLQEILREFLTSILNCEISVNDVFAVIWGLNDYDLMTGGCFRMYRK